MAKGSKKTVVRAKSPGSRRFGGPSRDQRPWSPPADMDPELARRVLRGEACGARCVRTLGGAPVYCANPPHPTFAAREGHPRRCKYHGGATPGAPVGNQNARKHGTYTTALLPGEEDLYQSLLKAGDALDEEIAITKVRLRRAVEWEARQRRLLESDDPDDHQAALTVESRERTVTAGGPNAGVSSKSVRRRDDWGREVSSIVGQLTRLLAQKGASQALAGGQVGAEDAAALARAALKRMREEAGA